MSLGFREMKILRIMKVLCLCLLVLQFGCIAFVADVSIGDDVGPEISNVHHVPKYPINGDDVTVYATVTDPDGIKNVWLSYCLGEICYLPVSMEDPDSDGTYSANIPWESGWENGTDIGYEINAEDNSDNQNSTGKIHFFFVSEIEVRIEIPETVSMGETIFFHGTALYNGNESAPVEYSDVTLKIIGAEVENVTETDIYGWFSIGMEFEDLGVNQINFTVSNRTLVGYYETTVVVIGISYLSEYVQVTTCYPGQKIWVNGTVRYNTEEPVVHSDVEVRINETLFWTSVTDDEGEYSVLITAPGETGLYAVNVTVMNGSLVAYNETSISVTEVPLPDLVLLAEEITFVSETKPPLKNDEVTIKVIVHNLGSADAANIMVSFYEGPPSGDNLIGSHIISQISHGSSSSANVTWIPDNGTYDIWVVVDPSDSIQESFEDNNNASKHIFVDNDFDGDGIGDAADRNDDNDAFMDEDDAFPYDPTEWLDSDADGIGDNADDDDDDDGYSDRREIAAGTDPFDPDSYPAGEKTFFEKYGLSILLMFIVIACMIIVTVILLKSKPLNP